MFACPQRIVDRMERPWREVTCITKMMRAELVGGAWEWHQDYGHWYHNCHAASLCFDCRQPGEPANGCLRARADGG